MGLVILHSHDDDYPQTRGLEAASSVGRITAEPGDPESNDRYHHANEGWPGAPVSLRSPEQL